MTATQYITLEGTTHRAGGNSFLKGYGGQAPKPVAKFSNGKPPITVLFKDGQTWNMIRPGLYRLATVEIG